MLYVMGADAPTRVPKVGACAAAACHYSPSVHLQTKFGNRGKFLGHRVLRNVDHASAILVGNLKFIAKPIRTGRRSGCGRRSKKVLQRPPLRRAEVRTIALADRRKTSKPAVALNLRRTRLRRSGMAAGQIRHACLAFCSSWVHRGDWPPRWSAWRNRQMSHDWTAADPRKPHTHFDSALPGVSRHGFGEHREGLVGDTAVDVHIRAWIEIVVRARLRAEAMRVAGIHHVTQARSSGGNGLRSHYSSANQPTLGSLAGQRLIH